MASPISCSSSGTEKKYQLSLSGVPEGGIEKNVAPENEIEKIVSQVAEECFNAFQAGNRNAVILESKLNNKKILVLGLVRQLSAADPFWKQIPQNTFNKIHFLVHAMVEIGTGNVKDAYSILGSYSVKVIEDAVEIDLIQGIEQCAVLICKKENARVRNELDLLKKLAHKNIIRLISDFKIEYISNGAAQPIERTILVEELMMGDMAQLYADKNFHLSLSEAKSITSQVISALEYLDRLKIVHPDIKSPNCLFIRKQNEITIKIADLEGCFEMKNGRASSNYTPQVAAPELVAKFANEHFMNLFQVQRETAGLYQAFAEFREYIPLRIASDVSRINHWGAGILIRETYQKLLAQKSSLSARYPWSQSLVKINKWAFPGLYTDFSLGLPELVECAKDVAERFQALKLEDSSDPEVSIIGSIALGFLRMDPQSRITFTEAKRCLDQNDEPSLKRKAVHFDLRELKKANFGKENEDPNIWDDGVDPVDLTQKVTPSPVKSFSPMKHNKSDSVDLTQKVTHSPVKSFSPIKSSHAKKSLFV